MNKRLRPLTISELAERAQFKTLEEIVAYSFNQMVPSERLTVTESALRTTRVPGGPEGRPWDLRITPYLQEPQDVLTSLDHQGMVFVGPARTGKTTMLLNFVGHTVQFDPTDMLLVHMNRTKAREWSKADFDRFLRYSTEVAKRQLGGKQDDNTFDKAFDSGMRIVLTYPTAENLSGSTYKFVWFIDYDRMDDDIDGEGPAFDLGKKRTTTFKRFAMTVAESSPNPDKEIADPKWMPKTPHEAPPITGIFGLYNRGDRRRWYWCCPQCRRSFEPDFSLLKYPESEDFMESAEQVMMVCPHDGFPMEPSFKEELNSGGRWVKDGMLWVPSEDKVVARNGMREARSDIASFWMKGPAAGYQDWKSLVLEYLRAKKTLDDTGDEAPLRKTITTDQGTYFISQARTSDRDPDQMKARAEDWGSTKEEPTVPAGVRCLVATVDVQKNAFVVQVSGASASGDLVKIDSFKLRLSERRNANGDKLPIDPFAYGEDWDCLEEGVMNKTYALGDGSGRRMRIRATACDSGGGEGTTGHAYNFWRKLRARGDGSHRRFALVKGDKSPGDWRVQTRWPDAGQKSKFAVARGDVPVIFINSNPMKDQVALMIARRLKEAEEGDVGGGMIRYPHWTDDWWYRQMTNEVRTEKGWEKIGSRRNEAFDLSYYAVALFIRPPEQMAPFLTFNLERIDWDNPPAWAAPWDENDLVFSERDDSEPPQPRAQTRSSFAELGRKLA